MADPNFEAAVAMLNAAPPDVPADAPAPDAPTTPAEAPAPDVPATPTTEAPAEAPVPVVDEDAALLADLEARKAARLAKAPPSNEVAELRAQLQALQARLEQPAQSTPDLRTLVSQKGHIEALRAVGIDPLEFFGGFTREAKANNPELLTYKRTAEEAKAKAEAAEKALQEREQRERQQAEARHQQETVAAYMRAVDAPDSGLKFLPKMDANERLDETFKTIAWLDEQGYDREHITDGQLAKLVDRRISERIARLAGTEPSVPPTPKTVPATDGAKTPATPPASLTNDLAAQSTGRERPMTEKERLAAATRIMQTGRTT